MKPVKGLSAPTPGLADFLERRPWSGEPRPTEDWTCFRSFDNGNAYNGLRDELKVHQHGLCAFCEIELTETDHQVEHFHPKDQAASPDAECDWMFRPDNLHAACKGGSVGYLEEPHSLKPIKDNLSCGQFKEGKVLDRQILKPSELPATPGLFRVDAETGRIQADADYCGQAQIPVAKAQATIDKLNLDCRRLRNARRAVMEELEKEEWLLGVEQVDDHDAQQLYQSMARRHLLPGDDHKLQPFFTTRRSFFGGLSETLLQQHPQSWL